MSDAWDAVVVGAGAAGVAAGTHANQKDLESVIHLFEAVGRAFAVDESDMDAITALSGSGPAYCFRIMEILCETGEAMGLTPRIARELTLQTFLGASKLAIESDEPPATLRQRVTSPGGTTEAALEVFAHRGLPEVIRAGVLRARERSIELAQR